MIFSKLNAFSRYVLLWKIRRDSFSNCVREVVTSKKDRERETKNNVQIDFFFVDWAKSINNRF
jgi:hypothetical protein